MFTTPETVSPHVLEFCRKIAPESMPVYVPVFPVKSAVLGKAFYFVREHVEKTQTGRAQPGWTIWEWPDMALEAEHNCVYDAQDGGSLRELAPYPERRILFLPDDSATYDLAAFDWPRKSVRSPLRAESIIHEYLGTLEMRDDFVRANLPPFETLRSCPNPRVIAQFVTICKDASRLEEEILEGLEFGFVSSSQRKAA